MRILPRSVSIVGLILSTLCFAMCQGQYVLTDLGTLGGSVSIPYAINDSGAVVGTAQLAGDAVSHAFFYRNGSMVDLGALGGVSSTARGVNDSGTVVGATGSPSHAFRYQGGVMADLGTLGGSSSLALAINDSGEITGYSHTSSSEQHAYKYSKGVMHDLGALGGTQSAAYAINNSGQVVGSTNNPTSHPFLYENGGMSDLGTLGSSSGSAVGINAAGHVVGSVLTPAKMFIYRDGLMTDLGPVGTPTGINDADQVVGSYLSTAGTHAFLWQNGVRSDLNDLVDQGSGWVITMAHAINNRGVIVAQAYRTANPKNHAVMLTPNIAIVQPSAAEEWAAGVQDTIRWTGTKRSGWAIYYSVDDGASYAKIDTFLAAGDTVLLWIPPDSLRTTSFGRIKVVDAVDESFVSVSGRITFRGSDLVKVLTDGTLRPYLPSTDGWSYENDTLPMWPVSWWGQFKYSTDIDPITGHKYPTGATGGIKIALTPSQFYFDWPLFVDTYTPGACYRQGIFSVDYNPDATERWLVTGAFAFEGACSGLATGSLLAFSTHDGFRGAFPDMPGYVYVNDVPMDTNVRKVLNAIQLTQTGQVQVEYTARTEMSTPRETLHDLRAMFATPENADDGVLALHDNSASGGHAVVPYRVVRDELLPTRFRVYVYDPNNPGMDNVYIEIDSAANTWTDHLPGLNFGSGSKGCYVDLPAVASLEYPILAPASPPATPLAKAAASGQDSGRIVFFSRTHNTVVTAGTGHQIGYADSVSFNDLIGGRRLFPRTGRFSPPIGYGLPGGTFSVTLSHFNGAEVRVLSQQGRRRYFLERTDALPAQHDNLSLSDGIGYGNGDAEPKRVLLHARSVASGRTTEYELEGLEFHAADSLFTLVGGLDTLLLTNAGAGPLAYTLRSRLIDSLAVKEFMHDSIAILPGDRQVVVSSAGPSGTARIYVDSGNDGTIDDTLDVVNELTGVAAKGGADIPATYSLWQNYPNPFNPTTIIGYDLPSASKVRLEIFNTLGQQVALLVDGEREAGTHDVQWDASKAASGVYFFRFEAHNLHDATIGFTKVRKMLLIH